MKAFNLVLLGSVLFAIGCSTTPSGRTVVGNPGSLAWFYSTTDQEKTEHIEQTCKRYGYEKGSDNWPECIQSVAKELLLRPGPGSTWKSIELGG